MVKHNDKKIPDTTPGENTDVATAISSKFWITEVTDQMYLDLYSWNGVASRAADMYTGDLTSDKYTVKDAAFEKVRKDLNIDEIFTYATNRAFVSGLSFIFLGMPDGQDLNEELTSNMVPDFLQVLPKSWFVLDEEGFPAFDSNTDTYEIMLKGGNTEHVHKSRLLKVVLNPEQVSSYRPAFRALSVGMNNMWSFGQAVFRGAAGLTHVKVNDPKKASVDGKTMSEIDALKANGTFNKINSETTFISDGRYEVAIKGIEGSAINVKDTHEATLIEQSIPLKIPWQILIGANAGSIAGSETNMKLYLGEVNNVRIKFQDKYLQKLAELFGMGIQDITFDTLFEETDVEKEEIKKSASETMKILSETGIASNESLLADYNERFGTEYQLGERAAKSNTVQAADSKESNDGLLFEYIVSVSKDFTLEQAQAMVSENGFKNFDVEIDDWEYRFFQFRNPVPGTIAFSQFNSIPNLSIEVAEIADDLQETEVEKEIKSLKNMIMNSQLPIRDGFASDEDKPFTPDTIPKRGSPWEKPEFIRLEKRASKALITTFNNGFIFNGLTKSMKGSIFFAQDHGSIINNIKNKVYKFFKANDAEKEALLLVEQEVNNFDNEAKLKFSPILVTGITAAKAEADSFFKKAIELTDRNKQIQKQIQEQAMDKITKVSDEMRGDLKRELEAAMINHETPRQAANRFNKYVSSDFANKYKNRLQTIAEQEMNTVFNSSAQATYEDSGIVDFNQWITAGDAKVRPEHAATHGQVVEVGKLFTLGVKRPPHGVRCRCAIVPFFPEDK